MHHQSTQIRKIKIRPKQIFQRLLRPYHIMVPQQFRKEADARIRIFRHHSFSNRSDFRNDFLLPNACIYCIKLVDFADFPWLNRRMDCHSGGRVSDTAPVDGHACTVFLPAGKTELLYLTLWKQCCEIPSLRKVQQKPYSKQARSRCTFSNFMLSQLFI